MKQELIVKSNTLLQHPLYKTSIELKIFSKIVLAIRKAPEDEIFTFQVKELIEDFGCHQDEYDRLKKVAKNMSGKTVDINMSTENICDIVVIFRRITIDKKGVITFKIEEDIKPFILNLTSNFTQYFFENIARLKSSFSIRIYELLKQYEKIGNRKMPIIALRHFLNVSDDTYKLYADFKKKTIVVAQKELKEKTDICFEFEEIKIGRKIVEINFVIFKNNKGSAKDKVEILTKVNLQTELPLSLTEDQESLRNKLVSQYKLSEKSANELVLLVKVEQIKNNINYAEKEYKNGKISKNFSGYLLNAIKNDYANNASISVLDTKQQSDDTHKKQLRDKIENLKSKLSLEFSKIEKAKFLNTLSESEKEELTNQIIEELKLDSCAVSLIKEKGLSSPVAGVGIIKRIPDFEKRKQQFIDEKLKEAGF